MDVLARIVETWMVWALLAGAAVSVAAFNQWRRAGRLRLAEVLDFSIGAILLALLIALATEGRGCTRATSCPCENSDVNCVERFCR